MSINEQEPEMQNKGSCLAPKLDGLGYESKVALKTLRAQLLWATGPSQSGFSRLSDQDQKYLLELWYSLVLIADIEQTSV
ncbi:hypothetical protein [Allopusillimonas ginsengisoli]|uniref:hypothetical protein n=1 Tax=Allopusillimonas ginsengisoli TaxID=453575 RepID=UPI00101FC752|nr:hypothetical protein [Allopusillimonas ginsengisoli]TEA79807.1 hypothetical protein ERE07_02375 [Allopusillimonas ginsengisoli]